VSFHRYIGAMVVVVAGLVSFVGALALHQAATRDHFMAARFEGDARTYRAFSNFPIPEIQDRDVYFHNIGHSIEEAKKADIIILGHSVWFYALDDEEVRAFNAKHGVRLFNMASAGNSSGDFIREVIKRWDIHPHLWVINDDDEAVSFFHPGIDDAAATGSASSINIVKTWRLKGFTLAFARNIRWSIADLVGYLPTGMRDRIFPTFASRFQAWRSVETGDWLFPAGGVYDRLDDPDFVVPTRRCPVTDAEIKWTREFVEDIGGRVILTLVPYARWCPQRVEDVASALAVEALVPTSTAYSNLDGRHMDRAGAKKFTAWFLTALEGSVAFNELVRAAP
jgi:hypothetical protein